MFSAKRTESWPGTAVGRPFCNNFSVGFRFIFELVRDGIVQDVVEGDARRKHDDRGLDDAQTPVCIIRVREWTLDDDCHSLKREKKVSHCTFQTIFIR